MRKRWRNHEGAGPVPGGGLGKTRTAQSPGFTSVSQKFNGGTLAKKDRLGENSILSVLLTEKFYEGKQGKLVLYKGAPREVWPIFLHFVDFSFLFPESGCEGFFQKKRCH